MASLLNVIWPKRFRVPTDIVSSVFFGSRLSVANDTDQESFAHQITNTSKRLLLFRLASVTFLPISIILALVATIFFVRLNEILKVQETAQKLRFSLEVSELVDKLQKERDLSVIYSSSMGAATKTKLVERYPITDAAIQSLTDWDSSADNHLDCFQSKEKFQNYLNRHRYELDAQTPTEKDELQFYSEIIQIFIKWFYDAMTVTSSGTVWKLLVALLETMEAKEKFGIERAFGSMYFIQGGFQSRADYLIFAESQDVANASLNSARQFSADVEGVYQESVTDEEQRLFEVVIRRFQFEIRLNPFPKNMPGSVQKAKYWSDNMTLYVDATLSFQNKLTHKIYDDLLVTQHTQMMILTAIGVIVFLVAAMCPGILKAIFSMTSQIQAYSIKLREKMEATRRVKQETEAVRCHLLPKAVAEKYMGDEKPGSDLFKDVTVMVIDLHNYSCLKANCSPDQLIGILDSLYTCLDEVIGPHDVYKTETPTGAYRVAAGLKHVTVDCPATQIASIALNIHAQVGAIVIPHMPGTKLRIRIGINTGPVLACFVDIEIPRYILMGETVNIASKLEETGRGGRSQVSEATYSVLRDNDDFILRARDSGPDQETCTYWLNGRNDAQHDNDDDDDEDDDDDDDDDDITLGELDASDAEDDWGDETASAGHKVGGIIKTSPTIKMIPATMRDTTKPAYDYSHFLA